MHEKNSGYSPYTTFFGTAVSQRTDHSCRSSGRLKKFFLLFLANTAYLLRDLEYKVHFNRKKFLLVTLAIFQNIIFSHFNSCNVNLLFLSAILRSRSLIDSNQCLKA